MPPVSMTRAEYEAKYGVQPVVTKPTFDTTPAPVRMTKDEYYDTYGVTPEGENRPLRNLKNRKPFFPAEVGGAETVPGNIERTIGNIPSSAINMARIPFDIAGGLLEADKKAIETVSKEGYIQGTKKLLGGFADAYMKFGEAAYGSVEKAYNALLDDPADALTKASTEVAKIGIEDPFFFPSLVYGGGVVGKKDIISKIASPVTRGADTSIPAITRKVVETTGDIRKDLAENAVRETADEIYAIEQKYVSGRKLNNYATDGGAESRLRIARSGVLDGAATTDGMILTKQPGGAVEKYRAGTVDKYEDVVKRGLEREGSKANLEEVRRSLVLEMNRSGLEGADLVTAMNGIEKELQGLAIRSDQSRDILLAKLQDAKISTTRNINYQTPPEVSTYRKAVARAYKNLIERKSKLPVSKVNEELAKFYKDIERLEALDGRVVKGGKLGKYSAQIAGNIAGGLAGGAIGGTPGAAIGTVIGGEVSAAMKGRSLESTFGKVKNGEIPRSDILEAARANANAPKVRDLKTPDPVVGLRKDIPKNDEVIEIESQIKNNVKQQKAAIKAGDFTLVQKLKEIYDALVAKLREVVEELMKDGPPMRGFVRIGGESKGGAKSSQKSSKQSPSAKTTTKAAESQEAFEGFTDLSTKLLEKLKGRTTVSRQFIEDLSNSPDLKQSEKDLIRRVLGEEAVDPNIVRKERGEIGSAAFDYPSLDRHPAGAKLPDTITVYRGVKTNKPIDKKVGEYFSLTEEGAKKYGDKIMTITAPKSDFRVNPYVPGIDLVYLPKGTKPTKISLDSEIRASQQISVPDFANRVKSELLPLTRGSKNKLKDYVTKYNFQGATRYESITLPEELRGPVANYSEHVYESPIKTSAGSVHFDMSGGKTPENYFAHTRIEDLPTTGMETKGSTGKRNWSERFEDDQVVKEPTRRVIEIQSDLFQKGRLEKEATYAGKPTYENLIANGYSPKQAKEAVARDAELAKLEPYRNTWHERVIREEVKQAAKDGKTKLQFPTGETAMKIEGLGERNNWVLYDEFGENLDLTDDLLEVGKEIKDGAGHWIITDVLGDGKFKAVPKDKLYDVSTQEELYDTLNNSRHWTTVKDDPVLTKAMDDIFNGGIEDADQLANKYDWEELAERFNKAQIKRLPDNVSETFDISGKVDTENPIYKFYEKTVQKYLANKYGGKIITDPQGVKWVEVDIKPEMAKLPIEAFAAVGAVGLGATQND